jgi:hypothetical protein
VADGPRRRTSGLRREEVAHRLRQYLIRYHDA